MAASCVRSVPKEHAAECRGTSESSSLPRRATAAVVADAGLAMLILLPAASTVAMTLGAVQLMKLANPKAQRRIAAGEFPDMERWGHEARSTAKRGYLRELGFNINRDEHD